MLQSRELHAAFLKKETRHTAVATISPGTRGTLLHRERVSRKIPAVLAPTRNTWCIWCWRRCSSHKPWAQFGQWPRDHTAALPQRSSAYILSFPTQVPVAWHPNTRPTRGPMKQLGHTSPTKQPSGLTCFPISHEALGQPNPNDFTCRDLEKAFRSVCTSTLGPKKSLGILLLSAWTNRCLGNRWVALSPKLKPQETARQSHPFFCSPRKQLSSLISEVWPPEK